MVTPVTLAVAGCALGTHAHTHSGNERRRDWQRARTIIPPPSPRALEHSEVGRGLGQCLCERQFFRIKETNVKYSMYLKEDWT